jgi:hypothetical protein
MSYYFRYKSFTFEVTPGDVKFTLSSYLSNMSGEPFLLSSGSLDTFNVVTYKTSLPASNYKDFLVLLSQQAIAFHYNQVGVTGNTVQTSDVIEGLTSTASLIPGMLLLSSQFPAGTAIKTVRDSTSVILTQQATITAAAATLTFSTASWFIDYSSLDTLLTQVNFANF